MSNHYHILLEIAEPEQLSPLWLAFTKATRTITIRRMERQVFCGKGALNLNPYKKTDTSWHVEDILKETP
jgi:REP element-mobilizing transposase RayT